MIDYAELRKELYEKFHDAYHKLHVSELQDEIDRLHEVAIFLFGLLDDIDTASDEAKNNSEWYRKRVEHIHRRRFEVMETDGYTVKVKENNV